MNLGRYIWGIFVVFVGIVFLLTNFGYISPSVWSEIWRFWPVALVIIGLSIISKALPSVIRIIVNILIILIVIASLTGIVVYRGNLSSNNTISGTIQTKELDEELLGTTKNVSYEVQIGAGNLNIHGDSAKLIEGQIETNIVNPTVSTTSTSETQSVKLSSQKMAYFPFFRGKNDWNVSLNNTLPVSLNIDSGAVSANLDISKIILKDIQIKSGASSYDITLGDKSDLATGEINIGASSVKLRVPKSVGLRFELNAGATSNNFTSEGLSKSGSIYSTDGYDSSAKKIDLSIKAGAASIELDRI